MSQNSPQGPQDPHQQVQQMQDQMAMAGKKPLSPEEQVVMAACQSESFWYRSLPISGVLAMTAHVAVNTGYLSPSPRFGSRPKVVIGSIIGYFLGKFSYVNECSDKFLIEAPDGHIAEMIRIRRGLQPRNITSSQGGPDDYSSGPFQPQQQSSPIYNNPNSPTYDPSIAQQQQQQQLSGYDELRRRNREASAPPGFTPNYQSQLPPSAPYHPLSPPPPPPAESAPPSKLRPITIPPKSGNNKYGDEGFE